MVTPRERLRAFVRRWRYYWPYLAVVVSFALTLGFVQSRQDQQLVEMCRSTIENRQMLLALVDRAIRPSSLEIPPDASPDLRKVMETASANSAQLREDAKKIVEPPACAKSLDIDQ